MKLKLILSTLLIGLVSLNTYSAPRVFEQIKKMDTDQDGTVTLEEFNSEGISASSDKAIEYVSNKKKLTPVNAEIFSIYVIGLHCPDII